jgi:ribose 5-phosphate isomerase A
VREGSPRSPDGGVIADWHGDVSDPAAAAALLGAVAGVIDHGLFPPSLVHDVLLADDEGHVEHRVLR